MLNAIIDYINDRTEATERGIYRALRAVLQHCIDMTHEIEMLRYPIIIESTPHDDTASHRWWADMRSSEVYYISPRGWDKIEPGEQQ